MSFGFETTALEVVDGVDLSGKRAIVTGGASGIGIPTAEALVKAGAEVTLAVRDVMAGERVAAQIGATGVRYLELAKLESVEALARDWDGPLHMLVNNAGVMAIPELTLSGDGLELQFATNHVGHFALAQGLHAPLAAEGGRIVSVSSSGHLRSPVIFDDLNFALEARRDLRQRVDAGRDCHRAATPPAAGVHRAGAPRHAPEDTRAGRGDVGPAGGPPVARAASRPTRSTPTTATSLGAVRAAPRRARPIAHPPDGLGMSGAHTIFGNQRSRMFERG